MALSIEEILGFVPLTKAIETVKSDLQHCVDSDVTARVFGTMVLP